MYYWTKISAVISLKFWLFILFQKLRCKPFDK